MSLPSPLTASDECVVPRGSSAETVKLSAGIHRQVWVSGTSIFADIRITNSSRKNIKKVELHLERDILYYKHVRTKRHIVKGFIIAERFNRQRHRHWRNPLVRRVSLTVTNAPYKAK